jgi:hypothetical protein
MSSPYTAVISVKGINRLVCVIEIRCQLLDIIKSISGFRGLKSVGSSGDAHKISKPLSVMIEHRAYVFSIAVHAADGSSRRL